MRSINCFHVIIITSFLLYGTIFVSHAQTVFNPPKGTEFYINDLSGPEIAVDSVLYNFDDKFYDSTWYSLIDQTYSIKNGILFEWIPRDSIIVNTPFDITLYLETTATDSNNVDSVYLHSLQIFHDTLSAQAFQHRDFFQLSDYHKLEVKILAIVINSDSITYSDVLNSVQLTSTIEVMRSYRFICENRTDAQHTYIMANDELVVYWTDITGATEYDLEWTFYDDSTHLAKQMAVTSGYDFYYGFFNNSTRVNTSDVTYNIPLVYPSGNLLYRVRGVQVLPDRQRIVSEWSYNTDENFYHVRWHEDSLNWQSAISFSEEGKRSHTVTYLDGTLRNHQTVTKFDNLFLNAVSNTLYDHYGRKAVSVLPFPAEIPNIMYLEGINENIYGNTYTKADFDTGGCGFLPIAMDSASGAASYYSSNNTFLSNPVYADDLFNNYIPNSYGYVFGITQYTQDNTSRIARQSSPGTTFNLGTPHNTQYFYAKANQPELDRLFGNDVGFAEYYNKNMVVDANGQPSISYVDDKGRTIATSLAGASPDNLLPLNSNLSPDTITFSLLDNNQIVNSNELSATHTLLVPEEGIYFFEFDQTPLQDSILNCDSIYICYDCLYELEINITAACTEDITPLDVGLTFPVILTNLSFDGNGILLLDTLCSNLPTALLDTFSLKLKQGSYHISKKLRISQAAVDSYKEKFLAENSCKSLEDFQSQFQNEIDFTGCQVDCESCMNALGDSATYVSQYLQDMVNNGVIPIEQDTIFIIDDYFNNLSICNRLCDPEDLCASYYEAMLADVSPGGQYFIYNIDTLTNIYTTSAYASVLNHYSPFSYQDVIFTYPNGNPITVQFNGNDVSPAQLPLQEFVDGFQQSWALSLVTEHPEYCYYVYCRAHNDANLFIQNMVATNDFYAAQDSGYLNPSAAGISFFPQSVTDPLFTGPNGYLDTVHVSEVNTSLMSYIDGCTPIVGLNIWQLALAAIDSSYDPCVHVIDTTWSNYCQADLNMFWHLVRSYYLVIRTQKYNEVWGHHAQIENCCNNCIGTHSNTFNLNPAVGITYTNTFACTTSYYCSGVGTNIDFMHKRKIFNNIQVDPTSIPTTYAGGIATGNAGIAQHCETVCDSYWQEIWELIQNCNVVINYADSTELYDAFLCVCQKGCDLDHPIGSNNIPPDSSDCSFDFDNVTYYVSSFEEIFNQVLGYFPGDTVCNPYLLALPPPFDSPVNFGAPIIWDSIPPCICEKLDTLYFYYDIIDSAGVPTFTTWLNVQIGSSLLETDVEYMMDRCDSTLNSCDFPLDPIEIPIELDCETCVYCHSITSIADEFFDDYPGGFVLNNFNNLFSNYLNHHLGFNLTHAEYINYLTECKYLWPTPDCSDLQDHVQNYFDFLAGPDFDDISIAHYLNYYLNQFYTPEEYLSMFDKCGIVLGTMPNPLDPGCDWLGYAVQNYISHHGGILTPEVYSDMALFIMNNYSNTYTNIGDLLDRLESTCTGILPTMVAPVDCDTLYTYFTATSNPPPSRYLQLNTNHNWNYTYIDYVCWFHYCNIAYDSLPVISCDEILHVLYDFDLLFPLGVPYYSDSMITTLMNHYMYAFTVDSLQQYIDIVCESPFTVSSSCDSLDQVLNAWLPYSSFVPMDVYINHYYSWDFPLSAYEAWLDRCGIPIVRICNRPIFPPVEISDNCDSTLIELANNAAAVAYELYRDSLINEFENHYISRCLSTLELFTCKSPINEYHFTLYYYDQSGNLIRTVPPQGVQVLNPTQVAATVSHRLTGSSPFYASHNLASEYFYNSFNLVHQQITPDAGKSHFWYDLVGRLVISQNAQQKYDTAYSYSMYDNLNRLIESGRIRYSGMSDAIAEDESALANFIASAFTRTEVTQNLYDKPLTIGYTQKNLRNRIAAVTYEDVYDGLFNTYQSAIHYSYDIMGNVEKLINDRPSLSTISQQFNTVDYHYDLLSGNVNEVIFQNGLSDQFIHHYKYDAGNRLTEVYTSTDGQVWDIDAKYRYFYHGPLARIELGTYSVQGIDHFYTLQGWLKGKNASISNWSYDMFKDGNPIGTSSYVSYDALSFSLKYFENDYARIGSVNAPETTDPSVLFANSSPNLYNGNIKQSIYSIKSANENLGYAYHYDQLNRYRRMSAYNGLQHDPNQWGSSTDSILKYHESVNYDANGNITNYLRHGDNTSKIQMDSLTYYYYTGKNQLKYVVDSVPSADYTDIDIDSQPTNNYSYDLNGNLVSDIQEGLRIEWYNNGKIKRVLNDTTDIELYFNYDPLGRRIEKRFIDLERLDTLSTLYSLDAQGNILAIYEFRNSDTLTLKDLNIYGSSRLGKYAPNQIQYCDSCPLVDEVIPVLTMGDKQYELTNHLGNVMTTISDKKIFELISSAPLIYTWKPEVLSWQDYYPFGMLMPGRTHEGNYRFGFGGQEKDDEIKGSGISYDFLFRIYDSRLGKFLSIDPLVKDYPWNSPYAYAENRVIDGIDVEGKEFEHYHSSWIAKHKGVSALKVINTNHGWGPVVMASYNLQVHGSIEAFRSLAHAYTTDPGIIHNPNNDYAQYTPMKQASTIQNGDHMKINIIGLGGAIDWDVYVRFTDIQISENSFSITASTLYGHTDAGFINFSGSINPETGIIDFSIYNETTSNVGLDVVGYGRQAQTSQWNTVLNNVESHLGGTTNNKTLNKEISIQNPKKGDAVKVVNKNYQTGSSSEKYKANE